MILCEKSIYKNLIAHFSQSLSNFPFNSETSQYQNYFVMDLQNILNQTMHIILNIHDSKLGFENKTWKVMGCYLDASSPALRQAM